MTLVLDNVSKIVGEETHIADASLVLEKGSLNVLLGQTLSGKTSLMRLMAGLDRPSRGRILVDGRDVTGEPVRRRNVAMVYQQFINYPSLTVFENIASPLRVAGRGNEEIRRRVKEAAGLLRLETLLERYPLELSGGQQQRTAIARALVKDAHLVLLDEPLANLDYKLREELREELPRIFRSTGAIFVYATTEPSEALLLGGHTACLSAGKIRQFGSTPDVYRRPADLVAAEVFSDPPLNSLSAEKSGGEIVLAGGRRIAATGPLASLADGLYILAIRADRVGLARSGAADIALPGRVAVSEITGSESFIHADLAAGGEARWVALAHGVKEIEPGTAIDLFIAPDRLFVFAAEDRSLVWAPPYAREGR